MSIPAAYLRFVSSHRRFLAFGFLMAALSGFGQTFFVSLFSEPIRTAFGLGHGGFGLYYGVATVASAAAVIAAGRWIDRLDLRLFAPLVAVGLAAGAAVLAGAGSLPALLAALFLLRFCGQGLMMHTAMTSMTRYFDTERGRAVGTAALGLPAAEALLPSAAVGLMAWGSWQAVWGVIAAVLLLGAVPAILGLLRGHGQRRRRLERTSAIEEGGGGWRRRDVLRDRRLYLVLPAVIAAPATVTLLFFHQVHIADERGWDMALMAGSFVAFAAAHVLALLGSGPLVDRITARRALPLAVTPLLLGVALAATVTAPWVVPCYLALAGASAGAAATSGNAIWAELYGVHNLGAIRALAHALMVSATAVTPPLTGALFDLGVPVGGVLAGVATFVAAAVALAAAANRYAAAAPSPRRS